MKPISQILRLSLLIAMSTGSIAAAQSQDDRVQQMAEDIQKAILKLPNYGVFDELRFGIRGTTVILKGYASRPTLKDSAERVTLKVKGVEEVLNQIEVLPNSSFDDELRADLYVNIYGHSALQRYNPNRGTPLFSSLARREFGITSDPPPGNHSIRIIVKNGNVTLEGFVRAESHRIIAEIRANSTAGVFSVTNDLVVAGD